MLNKKKISSNSLNVVNEILSKIFENVFYYKFNI